MSNQPTGGPAQKPVQPRTYVYVDGFNLYYNALKGTPYKWLDVEALARRLVPTDQLVAVRYFTARVRPRPDDPQQPQRQPAGEWRDLHRRPSLAV